MKKLLFTCALISVMQNLVNAQNGNLNTSIFCDSLNTIYNHSYQNHGAMFNVVAKDSIALNYLYANLATGVYKYYIYYKQGSFVGFETNASAWTIIDSVQVQSVNNGSTISDQPTLIPINIGLQMYAGDTIAIYLTSPVVSRVYLKSTTIPWATSYVTDSSISISVARSIYQRFNIPFSTPQIWNGTVTYCKLVPTIIDKKLATVLPSMTCYISENSLHISIDENTLHSFPNLSIRISDLLGREVETTSINSGIHTMDVSSIPKGVYFCSLRSNTKLLSTLKILMH